MANYTSVCKNGHKLEGDNVITYTNGRRRCRICNHHWRDLNKSKKNYLEISNASRVKATYGVSRSQWQIMFDLQLGVCAICEEPSEHLKLSVDHDHSCCNGKKSCGKCVRGLICGKCNFGLGNFKDDPSLLLKAVDYIMAYRK